MKDIWEDKKPKRSKIKKEIIILLILLIIAAAITTFIFYKNNGRVKDWVDKNIFRKEVHQEQTVSVELEDENTQICAYSQYLGLLSKNVFKIYINHMKNMEMQNLIYSSFKMRKM